MHPVAHVLFRVSNQVTRWNLLHHGAAFPMYSVTEYPKSGGTWLTRMTADVLGVPFPWRSCSPVAMASVVHNHWPYHPRMRGRVVYMYRDGRDIMVSFYFHRLRWIHHPQNPRYLKFRPVYDRLFGKGYDWEDCRAHLARFMEHEFAHPNDCRQTWREHLESWLGPGNDARGREGVSYVSYEQLREDCGGALARVAGELSGKEPEAWRVKMAVEKFSMERMTGRRPGQESKGEFIRKGVVGDWVNHFTRESAELFDRLAGDMLVRLGYERDRSWVSRLA